MNLISCESCGVVLDAEKLPFPKEDEWLDKDGILRHDTTGYIGDCQWAPKTQCPVCKADITHPTIKAY